MLHMVLLGQMKNNYVVHFAVISVVSWKCVTSGKSCKLCVQLVIISVWPFFKAFLADKKNGTNREEEIT